MSRVPGLTRRDLLSLLPGGLALLWPWAARAGSGDERLDACLALFSDRESAAQVGRAYLDSFPSEGAPALLLELLDPPPGFSGAPLRRWAATAVRRDFESSDTVALGGWRLARTEARLCGLVAAVSRGP
jgi:hypothetical protein